MYMFFIIIIFLKEAFSDNHNVIGNLSASMCASSSITKHHKLCLLPALHSYSPVYIQLSLPIWCCPLAIIRNAPQHARAVGTVRCLIICYRAFFQQNNDITLIFIGYLLVSQRFFKDMHVISFKLCALWKLPLVTSRVKGNYINRVQDSSIIT